MRDEILENDDRHWFGDMTIENAQLIYERICRMLKGKQYTWVEAYEYARYRPVVRVHQQLKDAPQFFREGDSMGFNFHDTYGVWGQTTSVHADTKNSRRAPYLVFEWVDGHQQLLISHYAPNQLHFWWRIIVE